MPYSELTPLSRFVCCMEDEKQPVSVVGASPSLLRVLSDSRVDGKRFVVCQSFNSGILLQCVRQAHQDVFGMVEITTLVDYTLHRLKSALYEAWRENKVVLRKCERQGYVDFCDLRAVLTDLIDRWPSIRPYMAFRLRSHLTGLVFVIFISLSSFCFLLLFFSSLFSSSSGGGMSVCLFFVIILRCIPRCRGQIGCWWPTI